MDENSLAQMVQSTKQFALLAETLERNTNGVMQQQALTAQHLQQTVERTNELMQMSIDRSGNQIKQLMQEAIAQTFEPGTQEFDAMVKSVSAQLKQSGEALQKDQAEVSSKLNKLIWKLQMFAVGSLAVLVLGGILLVMYQRQAYEAAKERARAAAIDAETAEAYRSVQIGNCGGRPCIKIDQKSEKWGKDGEFVLLDIELPPERKTK